MTVYSGTRAADLRLINVVRIGVAACANAGVVAEVDVAARRLPGDALESLTKNFLRHVSQVFMPQDLLCHTRC